MAQEKEKEEGKGGRVRKDRRRKGRKEKGEEEVGQALCTT